MIERHRILGLAHPRSQWFRDVSLWANTGLLSADFVKCVSAAELLAHLGSSPATSVVMFEPGIAGVDRRFQQRCTESGVAMFTLDNTSAVDGAVTVDPETLTVEVLQELLATHCVVGVAQPLVPAIADTPDRHTGRSVAVLGTGNSGGSVVACGVAQALADDAHASVVLADLKRRGDLAMMHDAPDVVPNFEDLVQACRSGVAHDDAVMGSSFGVSQRGYSLVLGMCRPSQWSALSEAGITGALEYLRTGASSVLDLDAELEGKQECGSWDVEERHMMSRIAVNQADCVVIVGLGGLKGLHVLARLANDLLRFGVEPDRIVTVVNRFENNPIARLTCTKTLRALTGAQLNAPLFIPELKVDLAVHEVSRLPDQLGRSIVAAIEAIGRPRPEPAAPTPEQVTPGSLGSAQRRAG